VVSLPAFVFGLKTSLASSPQTSGIYKVPEDVRIHYLLSPNYMNIFDSSNGPDYFAIFQQGRLNPNIEEHRAIIEQFLRAIKGTQAYKDVMEKYETAWGDAFDRIKENQKTEPKSVNSGKEKTLEEAMVSTSDPATRIPKVVKKKRRKSTKKTKKVAKKVQKKVSDSSPSE